MQQLTIKFNNDINSDIGCKIDCIENIDNYIIIYHGSFLRKSNNIFIGKILGNDIIGNNSRDNYSNEIKLLLDGKQDYTSKSYIFFPIEIVNHKLIIDKFIYHINSDKDTIHISKYLQDKLIDNIDIIIPEILFQKKLNIIKIDINSRGDFIVLISNCILVISPNYKIINYLIAENEKYLDFCLSKDNIFINVNNNYFHVLNPDLTFNRLIDLNNNKKIYKFCVLSNDDILYIVSISHIKFEFYLLKNYLPIN